MSELVPGSEAALKSSVGYRAHTFTSSPTTYNKNQQDAVSKGPYLANMDRTQGWRIQLYNNNKYDILLSQRTSPSAGALIVDLDVLAIWNFVRVVVVPAKW